MNYYFDFVKPEYYDSIREYRNETLACESRFDGCFCLEDYDDIEKWDLNCKLFENEATLPPGYSIGFQYVYMEDNEVVGMVNFRPKALEHMYLRQYGGHIGYSVKPSKRKQGIATRMLKDFLKICKDEYHLKQVLITCNENNVASRKVIIKNGGILEEKVFCPPENCMIERYWISL